MIPSPKDRFLADTVLAKHHADMVSSSQFAAALDASLREYSAQCARSKSPSKAGLLLQGAHDFVDVFCNLAEKIVIPATKDRDNL